MTTDSSREALDASSPVARLRGIGPVRSEALREAGVETLLDLLLRPPRTYEDRRVLTPVAELRAEGSFTVRGRLSKIKTVRLRHRRMTLVRAILQDESGELAVTWFNRPYLEGTVDPEKRYLLHGSVRLRGEGLELSNPSLEVDGPESLGAAVVPVYSNVGSLAPSLVRQLVRRALEGGALASVKEPLPPELLARHGLPELAAALEQLHQPPAHCHLEALLSGSSPAHGRLVYGEMLAVQTELALARRGLRRLRKAHRYREPESIKQRLVETLPFRLTGSQDRVLDEILDDLTARAPMMRLLQGDVGSGKTVVAGIAMAAAAESGLQAALMAPTELLAEQHHRSLLTLLGDRFEVCLLTSSASTPKVREDLRTGRVRLCVGTHALMQDAVEFERLALVVVDEQHRFGVAQRRDLVAKGERADLLVMTATPIPRSLAMTVYGDLAVSVIDELPPGRQPVVTRIAPAREREAIYRRLAEELGQGRKAFVVLPLIEESDKVEAEAVEGLGRSLAKLLREYRPEVLHGRMDSQAKGQRMAAFASGNSQVLIATTLIEVGVDVPEATVMIIESAERFGLAQLHQLRGRVGRGTVPSTCIALHGKLSEESRARLKVFASTSDGFALADADLEMRGPGDLLGTRQAGIPNLRLVDLVKHRNWIEAARRDAREMVSGGLADSRDLLAALGSKRSPHDHLAGG